MKVLMKLLSKKNGKYSINVRIIKKML